MANMMDLQTHSVTFVWNGHEGENVELIGDFSNWKESIKATHKGGPRYEAEVRLAQGKYYYKFIVNGDWRHSTSSPTERDDRGNLNNILEIGELQMFGLLFNNQERMQIL
ncbi:hypothetical protein R6Q59_008496 [Mikania micrantha]